MDYITRPYKKLVSSEQYNNAKTHWEKLINKQLSGDFNMEVFTFTGGGFEYVEKRSNICGTCGCSAGYLPETLEMQFSEIEKFVINNDCGLDFSKLVFEKLGINNILRDDASWDWCFLSIWEHTDNTSVGAGKRLQILFEQGLPENWEAQMYGEEPLMY